ncbi:MAG: GNAT family N-acetyltransferase [Candidatus Woesearchaeota archaeon]
MQEKVEILKEAMDPPPLHIRKYEKNDFQEIERLVTQLYEEFKDTDYFDDELIDMKTYTQGYLQLPIYNMLVAEKEKSLVGFILGEKITDEIYDILMHYVQKEYRRQGIASKLKEAMTAYAKQQGYKKIRSLVRSDNVASIQLNEKAKWEKEKIWYRYVKILHP